MTWVMGNTLPASYVMRRYVIIYLDKVDQCRLGLVYMLTNKNNVIGEVNINMLASS